MDDEQFNALVRCYAYKLWEEAGRPEGAHEEHWRRAWNELRVLREKSPLAQSPPADSAENAPQQTSPT